MLDHLNPEQKEAVLHNEGPSVVFAGAGSGKTRVITTRIIHLMEQGVPPHSILAVTFTNKAAKEMRERLMQLSRDAYRVQVGTFHSSCARWLREFASELGFSSDFTIYDDKDSIQALKSVLKEIAPDIQDHTPKDYLRFIGRAKTYACLPLEVESTLAHEVHNFPPMAVKVYEKYQNYLTNCNAMDFSDLLMNMLILLKNNKLVRQTLQTRFRYILIDEYQDTNLTQFNLINLLVNEKQNLFVVGDDDQSIYSWRGANPHNIIDFQKYYPKAKTYRLEQNYRSSANIVDAASALIKHNKTRAPKNLWTRKDPGEFIEYKNEYDSETEAWFVADSIQAEKSNYSYNNIAVLYRTNAQSRQIEDILRKQKIPYRIYGSLRFYDRMEIKDLLAYCRLIANPDDDIAFRRSLNMPPRGIGKKTIETIEEEARRNDFSLYLAAKQMTTGKPSRTAQKIANFLKLIEDLKSFLKHSPLEDFLVFLLEKSDYRPYLEKVS